MLAKYLQRKLFSQLAVFRSTKQIVPIVPGVKNVSVILYFPAFVVPLSKYCWVNKKPKIMKILLDRLSQRVQD